MTSGSKEAVCGERAVETIGSGEKYFQFLSFTILEIPEFLAMEALLEVDEGKAGLL